jgi:hypothetical protein
MVTNDSGRRLGATIGLDQTVRIDENWSVTGGLRNRNILKSDQAYTEVLPDAAISPFEVNEDFTSAYVGAGYRNEIMSGSVRGEVRDSSESVAYVGSASIARELSDKLSLAGAARAFINEPKDDPNATSQLDIRLGGAWRPRDEDTVIFDRLDLQHTHDAAGQRTTKIVNNLALNTMVSDRWQLSTNWGAKNVRTEIAGQEFANTSHLLGAEMRYDVTEKIDLGLRGSLITTSDGGGTSYSWGPSIGISPVKNVWLSAGYNLQGFKDDDFENAEYSREGVYLQMRLKFDQNTASGLLRRISPASIAGKETMQPRSFNQP